MDNNGKINRGIDLGTTNSAIAVMENGMPVIKKSKTQKDTTPSVVSINRKQVTHVGDTAANEMAQQIMKATKNWSNRNATSDVFKEFKRKMGTKDVYHSKNLKADLTPQQLSAEVIKALASYANADDGGSIVISVPAKFDANQKTATVEAARLAGFKHVELIQEPIAAAIAYGAATNDKDGFWLVFDLGGGTFDVALLSVQDGAMQVVDTEGDSFLGGKDIDYAIVDSILLPYVKNNYQISKIVSTKTKMNVLREVLKMYAENAKIELSSNSSADILSDLGDLGHDDSGEDIVLDLTITRDMMEAIMDPFLERTVSICQKVMERNNLDGEKIGKLILVGGPTLSPYLRKTLRNMVTGNVDVSADPMTAVAKGAALFAATRDIPAELMTPPENGTIALELHYETMAVDTASYLALKVREEQAHEDLTFEVTRDDGAWTSGQIPYEKDGIVIELALVENEANCFSLTASAGGRKTKISPDSLTILHGIQAPAAPLPYQIGFGAWDSEAERQMFLPFIGLEKGKPLPAIGVAHGRKTTMKIIPGDKNTFLKIPVIQAPSFITNAPAALYEHVADVIIDGDDVENEIPAGTEVEIEVAADSSEMMTFTVSLPDTDMEIVKELDTSPRYHAQDAEKMIAEYAQNAHESLIKLNWENVAISALEKRLYMLKNNRLYTEAKAIVEHYRELLRDIYQLECDTEWDRLIAKVDKKFLEIRLCHIKYGDSRSMMIINHLEKYIENAKEAHDVPAARNILDEISFLKDDLIWQDRIPCSVEWYDENFHYVAWTDEDKARIRINEVKELIKKGNYTKYELKSAFSRILNELDDDEVREAGGLLG